MHIILIADDTDALQASIVRGQASNSQPNPTASPLDGGLPPQPHKTGDYSCSGSASTFWSPGQALVVGREGGGGLELVLNIYVDSFNGRTTCSHVCVLTAQVQSAPGRLDYLLHRSLVRTCI